MEVATATISADSKTIIQQIENSLSEEEKNRVKAKCQAIIEEKTDILESFGLDRSMVSMFVDDLVIALSL